MKSYTNSTVKWTPPVEIRFRCPKCGGDVSLTRYMRVFAQSSVRGYNPDAAKVAAMNRLVSEADEQLSYLIDYMKMNRTILTDSPDSKSAHTAPFKCPDCGIISIPDAGCKRQMLLPKWFEPSVWSLLGAGFITSLFGWGLTGNSLWILFGILGIAVFLVPLILITSKRSRRAYADPAYMEEKYRSALNDAVFADMTPYGFGMVHLGSGTGEPKDVRPDEENR